MYPRMFILVDPSMLHLPRSQQGGVDMYKYQRQVAKFGTSTVGMPPPVCYRGADGKIMIWDGVTRVTRVAKLLPGTLMTVEIERISKQTYGHLPTIGDKLP